MSTDPSRVKGVTVGWQDELRRLDGELAAGRLSAEEYRGLRDALLSATSGRPDQPNGDQDQPAQPAPPTRPAQADRPAQPAMPAEPGEHSPFPAPFRWDPQPAESTHVMTQQPNGPSGNAERTQVVHGSGAESDPERTQVVPGQPPSPGPRGPQEQPGFAPRPASPWGYSDPGSSVPPWANSDLPPVYDPSAAWMRQGPESFQPETGPRRGLRVAGMAIAVVLVLGVIVAGTVYLIQRDRGAQAAVSTSATTPTPTTTTPATTTTRQVPEPPPPLPRTEKAADTLVTPPGVERGGGGQLDLAKIEAAKLFGRATLDALVDGDLRDGILKTTTARNCTIGMYALTMSDTEAAQAVVTSIGEANAAGGIGPDASREQKGVKVYGTSESAPEHVYRAVYVVHDRAVEVEVFGPDRATVLNLFDELLSLQLKHAPPTVR